MFRGDVHLQLADGNARIIAKPDSPATSWKYGRRGASVSCSADSNAASRLAPARSDPTSRSIAADSCVSIVAALSSANVVLDQVREHANQNSYGSGTSTGRPATSHTAAATMPLREGAVNRWRGGNDRTVLASSSSRFSASRGFPISSASRSDDNRRARWLNHRHKTAIVPQAARRLLQRSLFRLPGSLEQRGRYLDACLAQFLDHARDDPIAVKWPTILRPCRPRAEIEELLHQRRQPLEAGDLRDRFDPADTVVVAADLNEQVDCRDDLLAHAREGSSVPAMSTMVSSRDKASRDEFA